MSYVCTSRNFSEFIKETNFLITQETTLAAFIQRDELDVDELQLFHALVR